jgi:diaminopimelate decarboxylase
MTELTSGIDYKAVAEQHMGEGGLFVYDSQALEANATDLLDMELPHGLTVRYAAKANAHPGITALLNDRGLHFDASSVAEASRLVSQGVDPYKISLSSQVLRETDVLAELIKEGIQPVATSLRQVGMLATLGCQEMAVRVNPGVGSGHSNRTDVGGPNSSFGVWHHDLPELLELTADKQITINRLHTHIGSGAKSTVWDMAIAASLNVAEKLPDVETLDMGGGYKVARMPDEESTDMQEVSRVFSERLEAFASKTGRDLKLEIEPGTYLVANAGVLLGRVEEKTATSRYQFLKLNVGMNAIMRPTLYGAQHPIEVLNDASEHERYVVVGPCCESGDILTPAPGDPEGIQPRLLNKAEVGDFVAIGGAGAYCASMSAVQYNDVPEATELMI